MFGHFLANCTKDQISISKYLWPCDLEFWNRYNQNDTFDKTKNLRLQMQGSKCDDDDDDDHDNLQLKT